MSNPPKPPLRVGLGRVAGVHGVQGGLKVRPEADSATADPEVFAALGEVAHCMDFAFSFSGADFKESFASSNPMGRSPFSSGWLRTKT